MTRTTPASLLAIAAMLLAGPGVPGMPARAAPANQPAASSPALPPDIAARVEQHNKALHDQLQITPQQQALWDRFAAVTLSNAADIGQAFNERGARLDTMTAAENMQSFAHVAQVHARSRRCTPRFPASRSRSPTTCSETSWPAIRPGAGMPGSAVPALMPVRDRGCVL